MKIIDSAIKLDQKTKIDNPIAVLANSTNLLEVKYDSVWQRGSHNYIACYLRHDVTAVNGRWVPTACPNILTHRPAVRGALRKVF